MSNFKSLFWRVLAHMVGTDGGLIRSGNFRVIFPTGEKTQRLELGYCGVLRAIGGGHIIRDPAPKEPPAQKCFACGGDCGQCGGTAGVETMKPEPRRGR